MPNQSRMTDITYIRTHEGCLYLAVVIDLWSHIVVGWSMGQRIDSRLAMDALMMALSGRDAAGRSSRCLSNSGSGLSI